MLGQSSIRPTSSMICIPLHKTHTTGLRHATVVLTMNQTQQRALHSVDIRHKKGFQEGIASGNVILVTKA